MSLYLDKIKQLLGESKSKATKRSLGRRLQIFRGSSGESVKHTVVSGSSGSHEERRKRRERSHPVIKDPSSSVEVD